MANRDVRLGDSAGQQAAGQINTSLRSAGWVSLWSLGQLLIQFALQVVLAKHFGAASEMDAFVSAIALPTVLSAIFVGSLNFALVPVFSSREAKPATSDPWITASGVLGVMLLFTAVVSTALFLFAKPITGILYPGFESAQTELTARLVKLLAWLFVTNGLISFSLAVLHCQKRFTVPAVAPVIGVGVTLAWTIAFHERGIEAVGYAVLIGSAIVAGIQMAALPLARLRPRLRLEEGTLACMRLMAPLVAGAVVYRLDPLVDRYLASTLPTGSVSYLGYAMRLVTALTMISTSGLAVVAFPNFARQHAVGHAEAFRAEVAHALRCLCVIMIPIVVGLGCCGHRVVRDLFERGEFVARDTQAVALLLVIYLGMVAGSSFGDVAAKVFFALSDTRTPTVIGCAGFGVGLALKLLLTPQLGVFAIALATSFYFCLNALVMLAVLGGRLGRSIFHGMFGAVVRSLVAASIAVGAALLVLRSGVVFSSLPGAVVGAAVYLAVLICLRDEFALRAIGYARELLGRNRRESADDE